MFAASKVMCRPTTYRFSPTKKQAPVPQNSLRSTSELREIFD